MNITANADPVRKCCLKSTIMASVDLIPVLLCVFNVNFEQAFLGLLDNETYIPETGRS